MNTDMFIAEGQEDDAPVVPLGASAFVFRGLAAPVAETLAESVGEIASEAPFRRMETPGGFLMSAAMTNCGALGWVSDRSGYRYSDVDPISERSWPPMPALFVELAAGAAERAGFEGFIPDACLINRYAPGARMSLHRDADESDFGQPIVSVSLGLPMTFQFGGLKRRDKPQRVVLEHGDVVVWGGADRLRYHGVLALKEGTHELLGRCRINLTFRRAR